ncbi:hypothetical protein [Amycolatopsis magusensis]|uniref:hypothetical protein n=1 Tax=Amycolatopsis magusensis TaxID=882444 RepID=UPI00379E3023
MPSDAGWRLVREAVLPFGQPGVCTVVHVRAYERGHGDAPVVILGEFRRTGGSGQSLTNAIESAAAATQAAFYPAGEKLRFIQHTPYRLLDHHPVPGFSEVTLFGRRRVGPACRWWRRRQHERRSRWSAAATVVTIDGATRHVFPPPVLEDLGWEFRGANWRALEPVWPAAEADALRGQPDSVQDELIRPAEVLLPEFLGDTPVAVWPKDLYVPELIGGPEAARIAANRVAAVHRRQEQTTGFIDALTTTETGAIVTLYGAPTEKPDDQPSNPST